MFSLVECNDFCEEFERNGFKIDYGYQHFRTPNSIENSTLLLIIGHKYWEIVFSVDSNNTEIPELKTQSQTSKWFGKEYKLAICSRFLDNDSNSEEITEIATGLIRVILANYSQFVSEFNDACLEK